jgi:aspartate/methionine/tyrosine aminotransferase
VQATIDAINNGKTTYAPPRGIVPLIETVADVISKERGIQYSTDEVKDISILISYIIIIIISA